MNRHKIITLCFGALASLLLAALIFWTIVPFFQARIYLKNMAMGRTAQILQSNFIFSPYNYAQVLIRNDLITYLNRIKITESTRPLFDKAIARMEEVISREGFDPYDYIFLARAYAKKGEIQKAEGYFKKAIEFSPKRQELFYAYGTFLLNQNRNGEARQILKHALDLGEQATLSHFYFGLAQMTAGENYYAESLDHLEFFFENDLEGPPDPAWVQGAYKTLLLYFYEKQDRERVLKVAARLAQLDKEQSAAFKQAVEIIRNTGQIPVVKFEK